MGVFRDGSWSERGQGADRLNTMLEHERPVDDWKDSLLKLWHRSLPRSETIHVETYLAKFTRAEYLEKLGEMGCTKTRLSLLSFIAAHVPEDIGASEWLPPDTAPKEERQVVEAIVENPFKKRMRVTLERMKDGGWWHDFLGRLPADWTPLAWHPADSTTLPPDWPR